MRKLPVLIAVIALVAILAVGVGPANAQSGRTYVVQVGDTLFSIAARFNVSVSELATINRVYDVNKVPVGQVLILPNPITGAFNPGGNPDGIGGPVNPQPIPQPYTPPVVVYPPGTTVTTVTT